MIFLIKSRVLIAIWLSVGYPGYSYYPTPSAASSTPAATTERPTSCYEYAAVPQQNGPPPQRQNVQDQSPVLRDQGYQPRPLPQVVAQRKQGIPPQPRATPQMLMRSNIYNMEDRVKTYVAGTNSHEEHGTSFPGVIFYKKFLLTKIECEVKFNFRD